MSGEINPKVSIITVYYNRDYCVEESIKSILNQSYHDFELILVNDGSTDGTLEEFRKINDPRVRIIDHQNIGFTKSMIEAIKESKGDYIALHGSGDISLANRIAMQCEVLDANKNVGLVGCLRTVENRTEYEKINEYKGGNWVEGEYFYGDASKVILQKNLFAHGSVMFRRAVYSKVGGYRDFFHYAQDRDLWVRMSRECEFCVLDEILYVRAFLTDSVSIDPDKRLIQRYLSELIIQCGSAVLEGKKDLVDQYGVYSLFFLKKTKRLSIDLSKQAIKWFHQGEFSAAYRYSEEAINCSKNLFSLSIWTNIHLLPRKFGKRVSNVIYHFLRFKK